MLLYRWLWTKINMIYHGLQAIYAVFVTKVVIKDPELWYHLWHMSWVIHTSACPPAQKRIVPPSVKISAQCYAPGLIFNNTQKTLFETRFVIEWWPQPGDHWSSVFLLNGNVYHPAHQYSFRHSHETIPCRYTQVTAYFIGVLVSITFELSAHV